MAKGQQRGNRELKKPKKKKEDAASAGVSVFKDIPGSASASKKSTKK